MISPDDISRALSGIMAAARGDRDWRQKFDLTSDAVFRSFWAFPASLPLIILATESVRRQAIFRGNILPLIEYPVLFTVSNIAAVYITWSAFIVLYIAIIRRVGEGWRVTPLIIGQNWAQFLVYLIFAISAGIATILQVYALLDIVLLCVMIFAIWLDWGICRRIVGLLPLPALILIVGMLIVAPIISSAIVGFFEIFVPETGEEVGRLFFFTEPVPDQFG